MTELASILEAVARYVRRYVVLTDAQLVAVALWTAHTYAIGAAEQSPYLAITSATKRSGNVLYRKVSTVRPTLLLDEVDAIWSNGHGGAGDRQEGLRAILNAGNRRGTVVPRCAGPQGAELVDFEVFGAKALAGIGALPDTVADRAIPVRLRRKTPTETVERFRRRETEHDAEPLRLSLASILEHLTAELVEARPELPEQLDDRAQDGWEPLLAIADAAEGCWPARARVAAVELSADRETEDETVAARLLADVRAVFAAKGTDRIATGELLEALAADEEAPWATWHRGEPMRARALADLLRPFRVRSRSVRLEDGSTPKGYMRESFADAWERYITPDSPASAPAPRFQSATTPQPARIQGPRGVYANATSDSVADTQSAANPHEHNDVAPWRIEGPHVEASLLRGVGDLHFLDTLRGAYRAGNLTHREYRQRVALHGAVRRGGEAAA
jgi:hypothetical protein